MPTLDCSALPTCAQSVGRFAQPARQRFDRLQPLPATTSHCYPNAYWSGAREQDPSGLPSRVAPQRPAAAEADDHTADAAVHPRGEPPDVAQRVRRCRGADAAVRRRGAAVPPTGAAGRDRRCCGSTAAATSSARGAGRRAVPAVRPGARHHRRLGGLPARARASVPGGGRRLLRGVDVAARAALGGSRPGRHRGGQRGRRARGRAGAAGPRPWRDRWPPSCSCIRCSTTARSTAPTSTTPGTGCGTRRATEFGWRAYLGDADPEVAVPARRTDLAGLPPAWIGVGTLDLFHDEDLAYAERLRAAGVPCEVEVVQGAFHGFDGIAPKADVSQSFFASQCACCGVSRPRRPPSAGRRRPRRRRRSRPPGRSRARPAPRPARRAHTGRRVRPARLPGRRGPIRLAQEHRQSLCRRDTFVRTEHRARRGACDAPRRASPPTGRRRRTARRSTARREPRRRRSEATRHSSWCSSAGTSIRYWSPRSATKLGCVTTVAPLSTRSARLSSGTTAACSMRSSGWRPALRSAASVTTSCAAVTQCTATGTSSAWRSAIHR